MPPSFLPSFVGGCLCRQRGGSGGALGGQSRERAAALLRSGRGERHPAPRRGAAVNNNNQGLPASNLGLTHLCLPDLARQARSSAGRALLTAPLQQGAKAAARPRRGCGRTGLLRPWALQVPELLQCVSAQGGDGGYVSLAIRLFQQRRNNRKWLAWQYPLLPEGRPSGEELLDALKFLLAPLFPNKPARCFLRGCTKCYFY